MIERDQYFLRYGAAEQETLQQEALRRAQEASWLFDQLALPVGAQVVEIGCGPRGCLDLLSERVVCGPYLQAWGRRPR